MGLQSVWTKEEKTRPVKDTRNIEKIVKQNGFKRLRGWFGAILDEFVEVNKFVPFYYKGNKIYSENQVLVILGLEEPPENPDPEPADAKFWLKRKEYWKKELKIDYD